MFTSLAPIAVTSIIMSTTGIVISYAHPLGVLPGREIAVVQILKKWQLMRHWFGKMSVRITILRFQPLFYSTYHIGFPVLAGHLEFHVKACME